MPPAGAASSPSPPAPASCPRRRRCPPCRAFTPTLAEVYAHTKAKGLEVILISGDKSEKEFTASRAGLLLVGGRASERASGGGVTPVTSPALPAHSTQSRDLCAPLAVQDYFGKMPWAALPFEDRAAAERLNTLFGVYGIPRLVIVGPDGEVGVLVCCSQGDSLILLRACARPAMPAALLHPLPTAPPHTVSPLLSNSPQVVAGDARGAVVANPGGFPWRGAAGPTFLEQ